MSKSNANATSFRPGRKKTGGRKAGVPNKQTSFVREAIILAAEAVGSDGAGQDGLVGYLRTVAIKNLPAFCSLLGRVLPLQPEPEKPPNPISLLTDEELDAKIKSFGFVRLNRLGSLNSPPMAPSEPTVEEKESDKTKHEEPERKESR